MNNHGKIQWSATKRVVGYLKETINLGIQYNSSKTLVITGYSDSDFANDLDNRGSKMSYIFTLDGSGHHLEVATSENCDHINHKSGICCCLRNLFALLCQQWSRTLDNKIPAEVIYLDFSKEFDKIPRKRLLYKLEHPGIFLFGYCTSELSATISYYIQMKIDFQSAMFGVEKFLIENNMNENIRERVMKFFELQWYYNKGVSLWKDPLLHNAPTKLQDLVAFKEKRTTIANNPIFVNSPNAFVDFLAKGAEVIVLPPGEMVRYAGKYSRIIYIIQEGYCKEEKEPGIWVTLGPGDFMGTRNALLGGAILTMVSTITHVKFLMLRDKVFNSATAQFPDEKALFMKCMPHEKKDEIEQVLALWKEHEEIIQHKTSIDMKKKMKFREWFSKATRESFIWVPDYCERTGEDYSYPFDQLGYFHRVRYFLLPICILPQGGFLKVWVVIRYTSVILIGLLIPYQQVKVPYETSLDRIMIIFDLVAYMDLYLMLFVGFYGDKNQLIIHPCKTAKHYIKGPFILDLIFCFPWELLVMWYNRDRPILVGSEREPDWVRYRIRLLKILQVYRLPSFFSHIEKNIRTSGLHVQIIKFLPFTLICLNACAAGVVLVTCRYFHITDISEDYINDKIAQPPGMGPKLLRDFTMFCSKDCWIERSKYQPYYSPSSIYMLAFYFSTGNLVGLGFGDLTAHDIGTLTMVILMMICGTFFFGYVFAYTASYTSDIQSKFSIYQGMLAELGRYFQTETVSRKNKDVCLHNANYRWSRSGGIEANQILSIVHPALHGDAAVELYQHTLELIPFFQGVDRNFFRIVGMSVREIYYTIGTHIFREDDVIDSIYIVHRGKVELKYYHNFHEEMVISLGVGGIMGNIGNTVKTRMVSTAIAMINTDILHMKTDDFHRILNNHPHIKAHVDSLQALQQHTDFCMPLANSEEKTNSIPELPSETSDEEADSLNDVTSSENFTHQFSKLNASRQKQSQRPPVVENEYKVLLFIFSPTKWFKMAILPESKVLYAFVILCVIGGYVDSILVTYQFAFQDFQSWTFIFMNFTDLIYIWNMFFQLHTAYLNRFSDYITDCKKIKER
ncbi:hypothetical protein WA026_020331 [Henosepilachna vigintioctopunctata]|uniref:Cyclic nucleotide-binding domain-containing protein n=1 Tax=Henosepilachna vigintioctopunctata TaxID=420089 RepID=A0AAW1TN84_9CUCU